MVFSLFKTKCVPMGCFGKLPIHVDFIKLRSENRGLSLLDKWIQEGIHFGKIKLEQDFKEHYRRSLHYNFIYQPKNADNSIAGILYPGVDKSGRCFPFVIFISTGKYQIDNRLGIFLSYLQDAFLHNALNIATYGWAGLDSAEFLKKYFNREVLLSFDKKYAEDYNNFIKMETIGSYFKGLPGDINEGKIYLILQNLLDIVAPLSTENVSRFSLGIKFPLSSQLKKNRFEITFWIDLMVKVFPFKKIFPTLFWSNGENKLTPSLFLSLNEPLPKHFLSLLNINSNLDDSVCDLSKVRFSKTAGIKNLMEQKYYMVKYPGTTLYDFLSSLRP